MEKVDELFKKIQEVPLKEKPSVFLEYCDECIALKDKGVLREEEVAYKITGCIFMRELDQFPEIEKVIEHASIMETPREMSAGAGINIGDKWTQEIADEYKQKEYKELMRMIAGAKNAYAKKFQYQNPVSMIEHLGWTQEQVDRYLSFLEQVNIETLGLILEDAGIRFSDNDFDEEQAVLVLTNGHDVSKEQLFKILDKYIHQ